MQFSDLATRTSKISLGAITVVTVLFCTSLYADAVSNTPEKPLEAWQEALRYSKDHPFVGFAVYGRTTDASARQNAEKIKTYLAEQGIKSKYYLGKENKMGSSIALFIQGVPYGPKGLSKAAPLIHEVIVHYNEEYR